MASNNEKTAMASEIAARISALVAEHGDMPIWFMDPMAGNAIPMIPSAITAAGGHVEVWPKS